MNVILDAFPDTVKSKVGVCPTTKILLKRLHNLYSKKHAYQDDDDQKNILWSKVMKKKIKM